MDGGMHVLPPGGADEDGSGADEAPQRGLGRILDVAAAAAAAEAAKQAARQARQQEQQERTAARRSSRRRPQSAGSDADAGAAL